MGSGRTAGGLDQRNLGAPAAPRAESRRPHKWTQAEDEFVFDPELTRAEIAAELEVTIWQVVARRRKLQDSGRAKWSEEAERYLVSPEHLDPEPRRCAACGRPLPPRGIEDR